MYFRWDLISRGVWWDIIWDNIRDNIPDIIGGFPDAFAAEEIMEPFFVSELDILDIYDIPDIMGIMGIMDTPDTPDTQNIYTADGINNAGSITASSAESVCGFDARHDVLSTAYGGSEALFNDFGTTLSPAEALGAALFIKEGGRSGEAEPSAAVAEALEMASGEALSFMTDTDIGDTGAFPIEYMPRNIFNDGVELYGRWDTYESASPLPLAKLREAAEEDEAGKRSAAEISINLGGITNNVSSEVDLDSIVEYLEENLYEAMSVAAESIHS